MKNKGSKSRKLARIAQAMPADVYRAEGAAQKNNRHARRRDAKLAKRGDAP
jgi:hypothetical protein